MADATSHSISGGARRPGRRRRLVAVAAATALLAALGACSDDDKSGAATSTTEAPGDTGTGDAGSGAEVEWDAPTCDQRATVDDVAVEPVADVDSDHVITSFDGTEIRIHWFPVEGSDAEPAPTVLMGPGWSLPGDTSVDGAPIFGAGSISGLHEAGYNVLTWDPRGFGASGGAAEVNAADTEGRDVQILLDWVADQPEALTDREGDPRVGMIGFSYGGGIQLTVAAIDCRVDALVPGLAWNSLETSLYRAETVKAGWASVLVTAAGSGTVDPHVTSAYQAGVTTGTLSAEDETWFIERGPGDAVSDIEVPTLFVHGTVDTLFTLDEVITNYRNLRDRGVPTAMVWFCGGHGTCRTADGDTSAAEASTMAWLDRWVKGDESVDTGERLQIVDQDDTAWVGDELPLEADGTLTAQGSGTLALQEAGGAGPIPAPTGGGDVLSGLVVGITPGPATNAVDVTVDGPDEAALALGAPTLRLRYTGTPGDGPQPTRVFAQLVDDENDVVVGNQITPIEVTLDGTTQETEVPLETIVQRVEPGDTLTLQLVATTAAYAVPQLGGEITFESIEVEVPLVTGLSEG